MKNLRSMPRAAYLARFNGSSRQRTESDLRCYLAWCAERGPDPLAEQRPHRELHVRWMQEIRRFKGFTGAIGALAARSWS